MSYKSNMQVEAPEPNKIDAAVSEACTRSGAFVLLLSMALFSLVPYWLEEPAELSANRYWSLRYNLTIAIEQLDGDSCWQRYKTSHEEVESMSIEQLLKVQYEKDCQKPSQPKSDLPPSSVKDDSPSGRIPAPTMMRVQIMENRWIQEIADYLSELHNQELLENSRKASGLFNYLIYRWSLMANKLIYKNLDRVQIQGETKLNKPNGLDSPSKEKNKLINYLALSDVRELASLEFPRIDDTVKFAKYSGKEVALTPGSLSSNLYMASLLGQVVILFVVMYFKVFSSEATLSASFPVTGTLFGAFSRSSMSVLSFCLGIWTPVIASVSVTWSSRKLSLVIPCILIGLAVLSIQRALNKSRFFNPLISKLKIIKRSDLPVESSKPNSKHDT